MRRIEYTLGIGYAGATHREVVEFDDDVSDAEINEDYEAWKESYIDGWWMEL